MEQYSESEQSLMKSFNAKNFGGTSSFYIP